jgi:predicted transcriptional regulator
MSTSIKLPPKLKARVASVAKRAGKSPHAFMVEAIERQTAQQERRERFVAEALAAEAEALETGLAFDADDVHAAMEARARGRGPKAQGPKLKARAWRG